MSYIKQQRELLLSLDIFSAVSQCIRLIQDPQLPPIRTEWACHRAALAGKQVSTPRQDPQNRTSRTDLLVSCGRCSKLTEEQALHCHVPRWLFPKAAAAVVLGSRNTTYICCPLEEEASGVILISCLSSETFRAIASLTPSLLPVLLQIFC